MVMAVPKGLSSFSEEVIVLVHTISQPVPEHVCPAGQLVGSPHLPVLSHVSTWALAHCVVVGLQATHAPGRQADVAPVHIPQVAPDLPHAKGDSEARARHVPFVPPLQQPPAQVFELHAQVPLEVSHSPFPHEVHMLPAVPHEPDDSDAHG
jgi:hypothetical protein